MTKAMPAIYVFKHMFCMTVFHICGSMEIIKNANLALVNRLKAKQISDKGTDLFSVHSLAAG
jgi:hypothetical protein